MNKLKYLAIALVTFTLSTGAYAHPGHGDTSHAAYVFFLASGFTGMLAGFYCLYKARRLQQKPQSELGVM